MKLIPLGGEKGKGKFAMIDDEDYDRVSKYNWCLLGRGYAVTNLWLGGGNSKTMLMHRFIMNAKPGEEVDHRDGNRCNNQTANLRLCTTSQNGCNRTKASNNTTGYKGVVWHVTHCHYYAQIKIGRKRIYLGSYNTAEEASAAYQAAAAVHHGEFARW